MQLRKLLRIPCGISCRYDRTSLTTFIPSFTAQQMSATTVFFLAVALAIGAWVVSRMRKASPLADFSTRVNEALYELGVQVSKLEGPLKSNLSRESLAYSGALGPKANAHFFAARFFLRATTEYPEYSEKALVFDGVLTRSISVMRGWKQKGYVQEEPAEKFILDVKRALIDGFKSQDLPEEEKLATEIQVLEL